MVKVRVDPIAEANLALLLIALVMFAAGWLIYKAATTQKFEPFDANVEQKIKATD